MATPLLIRKNLGMISNIKSEIEYTLPYLQQVVTSYYSITELFDIQTIRKLLVEFPNSSKDLESIIKNDIISSKPSPELSGMQLSKRVLSEFTDIPDCSELYNKLKNMREIISHNIKFDIHEYFKLTIDTENSTALVAKEDNIDSVIEDRFSYYTKNDNQIEFVTKINQILEIYTDLKRLNIHHQLESQLKKVDFLCFNLSGTNDFTIREGSVYQIN